MRAVCVETIDVRGKKKRNEEEGEEWEKKSKKRRGRKKRRKTKKKKKKKKKKENNTALTTYGRTTACGPKMGPGRDQHGAGAAAVLISPPEGQAPAPRGPAAPLPPTFLL